MSSRKWFDSGGACQCVRSLRSAVCLGPVICVWLVMLRGLTCAYTNDATVELLGKRIDVENATSLNIDWVRGEVAVSDLESVARLTNLQVFVMQALGVKGALPSWLFDLTKLEVVDLQFNSFSSTISPHIARLTALSLLDLRGNDLRGGVPSEIGRLAKLTGLKLQFNQLSGSIPTELGSLTLLDRLKLQLNRFTSALPKQFGRLSRLQLLHLEQNQFTDLSALKELDHLVTVTLGELYCDCKLLAWYPEFIEKSVHLGNVFQTAICSDANVYAGLYPHILTVENHAPCSHAIVKESRRGPRHLNLTWSYPYFDTEIKNTDSIPVGFVFPNLTGSTHHDDAVPRLTSSNAAELFRECRPLYLERRHQLPDRIFAYQVEWKAAIDEASAYVRKCLFARDVLAENSSEFSFVIDGLLPYTDYELAILPFFVTLGPPHTFAKVSYILGLRSKVLRVQTRQDVPETIPHKIEVGRVTSTDIEMSWSEPAEPGRNGEIQQYEIQVLHLETGVVRYENSSLPSKTIRLGPPFPKHVASTKFAVKIRAKTRVLGYSNWSTSIAVKTCPEFMSRRGSAGPRYCNTVKGYYKVPKGTARSCADLKRDMPARSLDSNMCLEEGMQVEDLQLSPGFWRANVLREDIRPCPQRHFCQPTQLLTKLRSPLSPDKYCSENHTGVYCSACIDDHVISRTGCVSCTGAQGQAIFSIAVLIGLPVLTVIVLFLRILLKAGILRLCSSQRSQRSRRVSGSSSISKRGSKPRIFFGYIQVLSAYKRTFLSETMHTSSVMLGFMEIFMFDFSWLLESVSYRCVYDFTHYDRLLYVTLTPGAVILAILLLCLVSTVVLHGLDRELLLKVSRHFVSAALFLLFMIYPYVSQVILETFWCEHFPHADAAFNLTTSALRADYRLSCDKEADDIRQSYVIYAVAMLCVYPIGTVVLYLALLLRYRTTIKQSIIEVRTQDEERVQQDRLAKITFLITPYTVERYWFEAYELVRKLTQICIPGFLQDAPEREDFPTIPALVSLGLAALFIVVLALLTPYKLHSDHAFALVSLLLLVPAAALGTVEELERHDTVTTTTLDVLVAFEMALLVVFVIIDKRIALRTRRTEASRPGIRQNVSARKGGQRELPSSISQNATPLESRREHPSAIEQS